MNSKVKVMLVEDEIMQRESLCNRIRNYRDIFEIVCEASNGKEALKYLQNHPVDVVFTDVIMPVMDGLRFVEEATKKQTQTKFIIVSGYSDFSYAQQAIKCGITEYLLKPISNEDLREVLDRLASEISDGNVSERMGRLRSYFSSNQRNISEEHAELKYRFALLAMGQLLPSIKYSQDYEETFDSFWNDLDAARRIADLAEVHHLQPPFILTNENPNELMLIWENNSHTDLQFSCFMKKLGEALNTKMSTPPVSVFYCSGEVMAKELYKSLWSMRKIFCEKCAIWRNHVVAYGGEESHLLFNKNVVSVQTKEIIRNLNSGNINHAKSALTRMLKQWRDIGTPLQQYHQNLLYFIRDLYLTQPETGSTWDAFYNATISPLATAIDFDDFMDSFFDQIVECCKFGVQDESTTDELAIKIKKHIEKHYSQQINISEIAREYNISSSHLARKFKMLFGQSPVNCIVTTRISKACEIMKASPEIELRKVGEMVGYSDYFYFSKLFKKYTGVSPSEYRSREQ